MIIVGSKQPYQTPDFSIITAKKIKECLDQSTGIILSMHPANEGRRYNVTSSLIGWANTQNDPWIWGPHIL